MVFCTKYQFREKHAFKRVLEQSCIIIQWPCINIKRHLNCAVFLQDLFGLIKYVPTVRALIWYFAKRSQIKKMVPQLWFHTFKALQNRDVPITDALGRCTLKKLSHLEITHVKLWSHILVANVLINTIIIQYPYASNKGTVASSEPPPWHLCYRSRKGWRNLYKWPLWMAQLFICGYNHYQI